MAEVTFQILEGMERGRVFADIETPFTIGREEDNAIQLNDERVSRFHLKIQVDADKIILTDLESTNGTRVNSVPTQLRVLQIGDLVSIGRCLLVYGSPEEIANRFRDAGSSPYEPLKNFLGNANVLTENREDDEPGTVEKGSDLASDWSERVDSVSQRLAAIPPPVPDTFRLAQQAQLADLISFIHQQLQTIMQLGQVPEGDGNALERLFPAAAWRQMIELEMNLARMIQEAGEPDSR